MQIRAAALDDVERLAAFMGRCTLAHQGVRRASADEMRQRLTQPGTDPALDTWLVEERGEVAGFGQVWPEEEAVVCYVRVDPAHTARGIASTLLGRSAARAHELAPEPALHATSWPKDESAAPLLEGNGFKPIRYLSLMTTDLAQPPESPSWPPEVGVRALDEGEDLRPIHEAEQAVFPERRQSLEAWLHEYGDFDPTLWFVRGGRGRDRRARALPARAGRGSRRGLCQRARRSGRPSRRRARARASPAHVRRASAAG